MSFSRVRVSAPAALRPAAPSSFTAGPSTASTAGTPSRKALSVPVTVAETDLPSGLVASTRISAAPAKAVPASDAKRERSAAFSVARPETMPPASLPEASSARPLPVTVALARSIAWPALSVVRSSA